MASEEARKVALEVVKEAKKDESSLLTAAFTSVVGIGTYIFGAVANKCECNGVQGERPELVGTWLDWDKPFLGWGEPAIQYELWKALGWAAGIILLIAFILLRSKHLRQSYERASTLVIGSGILSAKEATALGLRPESGSGWHRLLTWAPIAVLVVALVSVLI